MEKETQSNSTTLESNQSVSRESTRPSQQVARSASSARKKRRRRKAAQIERKYWCRHNGCEKAYGSAASLHQHIRLKHSSAALQGPQTSSVYSPIQVPAAMAPAPIHCNFDYSLKDQYRSRSDSLCSWDSSTDDNRSDASSNAGANTELQWSTLPYGYSSTGNDLPLDMLGFSLNDPYRSGSESLSSSCSSSSIDGNQSDGGQWAEYSYGYPKPMTSDELLRSDLELFYPVENSPSPPPPPQSGYGNVLQSMLSNSTLKCDPLSPEELQSMECEMNEGRRGRK